MCRTPHGVRGLKSPKQRIFPVVRGSHPSRGAWIEITAGTTRTGAATRRTPHGVRGLKWVDMAADRRGPGRTPHGVRGLKFIGISDYEYALRSHPSRGAWIEISEPCKEVSCTSSHPSRGAWIEIRWTCWCATRRRRSHPSRGAWIEMASCCP